MSVTKGLQLLAPVVQASYGPVSSTGNSQSTAAYLDMGKYEQVRYLLSVSLGSTNTFDAMVLQATTTGGASAKAITGKALTQIVNGTTAATVTVHEIVVKATDLDINTADTNGTFQYIKLVSTVGVLSSANVLCVTAEASDVRTSPQTAIVTQSV